MDKTKLLVVIPARSGSKGVRDKNIQTINGKTLLEHAVRFGQKIPLDKDIYVSTDSSYYEKIALAFGAKSIGLRPKYLSDDKASTVDVIIDLLEGLSEDYSHIVLLQPTSPIRKTYDVTRIIEEIEGSDFVAGTTIGKVADPHPYKMKSLSIDGVIRNFLPGTSSEVNRQSLPICYSLTGGVYVITTGAFRKFQSFLPERTFGQLVDYEFVNVDTYIELDFLKYLIEIKESFFYE